MLPMPFHSVPFRSVPCVSRRRWVECSGTTVTIKTWREDAVDAGVVKVAVDAGVGLVKVDVRCSQTGLEEAAVRFVRARATRAGEDTPGRRTRTRTG